jgi:hypothetical protein
MTACTSQDRRFRRTLLLPPFATSTISGTFACTTAIYATTIASPASGPASTMSVSS